MESTAAVSLIKEYINHYHLEGWKPGLCRGISHYAFCNYREKTISVSVDVLPNATREDVIELIRHEIAHALDFWRSGHGKQWKYICRVVGAKPERCSSKSLVLTSQRKYKAVCPTCGKKYYRNKMTELMRDGCLHCTPCMNKVESNMSRLKYFKNDEYVNATYTENDVHGYHP